MCVHWEKTAFFVCCFCFCFLSELHIRILKRIWFEMELILIFTKFRIFQQANYTNVEASRFLSGWQDRAGGEWRRNHKDGRGKHLVHQNSLDEISHLKSTKHFKGWAEFPPTNVCVSEASSHPDFLQTMWYPTISLGWTWGAVGEQWRLWEALCEG